MNPYNFSMLVFATGSFILALIVFLKRQDATGRAFFVFSVFVTIWAFFHGIEISQNITYDAALLCGRMGQASAVFIMTTWLHLTLIINNAERKYRKWLTASYLVSFFIVCFAFTPFFIPRVAPTAEFLYYHRRGPVYDLFAILFFIIVPMGFVQLIQKIRRSSKYEAIQLTGFSIGAGIGFLGGFFAFLPIYDILFPQYNLLLLPIYPFVTAYFMIRHRLFDVEQVIEAFQKEKLATLGLLTASINHEIRNPLYVVKGLLETFIENERMGISRKTPLETSEKALKQVSRALDVISKLNRFAKPTGEASNQAASIPEALQAVLDLVSYEFELDKIHIKNQVDKNIPTLQADQRQLEEILFNLIVNACQAMKEGGELVIQTEKGTGIKTKNMPVPFSGDRIIITISDTGTGISPEQAQHLFEPFHTTKGEKGTGLGLYITKQLIERNNGKISVQSKPGQGTSFVLAFKVC